MRLDISRQFLAGSLVTAAALFAAGGGIGAQRTVPNPVADPIDAPVAAEQKGGAQKSDEEPESEPGQSRQSTSSSAGSIGQLASGDPLYGYPDQLIARVIRGEDSVRVRGAFWMAFPYAGRQADATDDTSDPIADNLVTLRSSDMVDTAHDRRIPAEQIRLIPEMPPLPAARALSTLQVDSTGPPVGWTAKIRMRGVRSGTYRGYLLATREEMAEPRRPPVAIPVTVYVKDHWLFTVVILSLTVPLFLKLRAYAFGRRQGDEAHGRIGQMANTINSDPVLCDADGAPFHRKFAYYLEAAAAALTIRTDHPGFAQHMSRAEDLWLAWEGGKEWWVPALQEERRNIDTLAATTPRTRHVAALLAMLRSEYEAAPDKVVNSGENDSTLAENGAVAAKTYAQDVRQRSARITRYNGFLEELRTARGEAENARDDDARLRFRAELDRIQREWEDFSTPENDEEADGKRDALRVAVAEARRANALAFDMAPAAAQEQLPVDVPVRTGLMPSSVSRRIRAAQVRRRTYVSTVTLIVFVLLLAYGFNETWVENPEFGADWVVDYFEVVAWGLGLNLAAFATLATFAGQWSLPWLPGVSNDPRANPDTAN